jgi:ferredoxin-thioredoxin reductase catalytic subunit
MQHALQDLGQDVSEQLGKLYSFKEEKAHYRKSYIDWDKIKRANNKAIRQKAQYLSKDAQAILAPVIQGLKKGKRVFFNHKYISSITLCKRRQNQNIIKQLESVLDITYHNSITYNGKKHRFSYEFSYKLIKLENTSYSEHPIEQFPAQQNDSLFIYNKNKDIEDIDLKSNFLQNSESSICHEKPAKLKTRTANERKKTTNAERKARVYHFNQYKEPQDLKHHYPLTKEDAGKLQSLSGRDFSLNAMKEILLDMSKRRDNQFCSKAQFLAYFGKCLRFEMRDAVKTCNDNFRIKTNLPKEEVKKPKIINEVAVRAEDLENRTTDGFQLLSVAIENLLVKSKAIME